MPDLNDSNNTETEIDFKDIMNVMQILDDFADSETGRLKLKVAKDPTAKTETVYHHGRCDVGSPWANGTPFDCN